jgi:hypothetical protein
MWKDKEYKLNILHEAFHDTNMGIVGLAETHWDKVDEVFNHNDLTIFQSWRQDGIHRQDVAIVLTRTLLPCVKSFEIIIARIINVNIEIRGNSLISSKCMYQTPAMQLRR